MENALTEDQIEAIDKMTENSKSVRGSCGHGYTMPSYPVHLPAHILNQLERMSFDD